MKKTKETPNVEETASFLPPRALLAVRYRDGNCNVECRVLYLGGPECAKITLQKSGSRGHSPTTPSITWCLPLVDTLEHAKTQIFNKYSIQRHYRHHHHHLRHIRDAYQNIACPIIYIHTYLCLD